MSSSCFKRMTERQLLQPARQTVADPETLQQAAKIVERIRVGGDAALLECAQEFDGENAQEIRIISPDEMADAFERIEVSSQRLLQDCAQRVRRFAKGQRQAFSEMTLELPQGKCGHQIVSIEKVGCYAPGGKYPLPSSVIMTAAVAREAGCQEVYAASPNRSDLMLAAGHVAEADGFICFGGAHAIAALAYGTETIPEVDMIVGPGNRWVTAAKQLVFGQVGIDMLAGPSELLIVADDSANPMAIAADLIAQAEHDRDARAVLVSDCERLAEEVGAQIEEQLESLPTAEIARESLSQGGYWITETIEQSIEFANQLAAEHLQLVCRNAQNVAEQIAHAGCIFIGLNSAEVFGDYGLGPNHTLPTARTARYRGGLSVLDFLRTRTWIELDSPLESATAVGMSQLAELEGLAGHQRACLIDRTAKLR